MNEATVAYGPALHIHFFVAVLEKWVLMSPSLPTCGSYRSFAMLLFIVLLWYYENLQTLDMDINNEECPRRGIQHDEWSMNVDLA